MAAAKCAALMLVAHAGVAIQLQLDPVVNQSQTHSFLTKPHKKKFFLKQCQEDIFMHYMKEQNTVLCGCGKCGTTSMYEYVFKSTKGKEFTWKDKPFVQDVTSERWEGSFEHVVDEQKQDKIMKDAFSFALIRDPKERLVSSWKSKVACDDAMGHDDTSHFVKILYILMEWEPDPNVTCFSLEDFAGALHKIHVLGNEKYLDRHFLPQSMGCFWRFQPDQWSEVKYIGDEGSFTKLAEALHSADAEPPHSHASTATVTITPKIANMLNDITAEEYRVLGAYLTRESQVKEGAVMLQIPDLSD